MNYVPPKIRLNEAQQNEVIRVAELLKSCNYDIEVWSERLGYELIEVEAERIHPATAVLINNYIIVAKSVKLLMTMNIAHEHCHATFHADCITYREMHKFTAGRNEGQAIEFSRYVIEEL